MLWKDKKVFKLGEKPEKTTTIKYNPTSYLSILSFRSKEAKYIYLLKFNNSLTCFDISKFEIFCKFGKV